MSRYFTEPTPAGFLVKGTPHPLDVPGQPEWVVDLVYEHSGGRRHPAHVSRKPCYLEIDGGSAIGQHHVILPDCYSLVDTIARCLLKDWVEPFEKWGGDPEDDSSWSPAWLSEWLHRQTSLALVPQVRAQWARLLAECDPTVLAVHKAVFSAGFGYNLSGSVIMMDEFYREKLLVKDVQAFRAAQVAAGFIGSLEKLQNWRSLFCPPNVRPYTALNKTLTALPGGVPARLLFRLGRFILPRPITNRLELITTILADGQNNFSVFAHAKAAEIVEAMQRVGRFLHRDLSHRRWHDVQEVVRFLYDCPERHAGRILGLADKSIRWHRDCQGEERRKIIGTLGHDAALARPPIPLPMASGVRFLGTVGDVCNEAELMGHCIASYARMAYDGHCYLFHVDYQGEVASVEVSPEACIVQAQGPRNETNRATKWAIKVLAPWTRLLRSVPKHLVANPERTQATTQDTPPRAILEKVLQDLERGTAVPSPTDLDVNEFLEALRRM